MFNICKKKINSTEYTFKTLMKGLITNDLFYLSFWSIPIILFLMNFKNFISLRNCVISKFKSLLKNFNSFLKSFEVKNFKLMSLKLSTWTQEVYEGQQFENARWDTTVLNLELSSYLAHLSIFLFVKVYHIFGKEFKIRYILVNNVFLKYIYIWSVNPNYYYFEIYIYNIHFGEKLNVKHWRFLGHIWKLDSISALFYIHSWDLGTHIYK